MKLDKVSDGAIHEVPNDFRKAILEDSQLWAAWEDITPLARNEWICWIESAKKADTRLRRMQIATSGLKDGKRRPCCWPGCSHR